MLTVTDIPSLQTATVCLLATQDGFHNSIPYLQNERVYCPVGSIHNTGKNSINSPLAKEVLKVTSEAPRPLPIIDWRINLWFTNAVHQLWPMATRVAFDIDGKC